MIIINADDLGRTRAETDATLLCHHQGRVTSATAMVFMEDSQRAAELAQRAGLHVGLHLNLSQPFSAPGADSPLAQSHARVIRFLTRRKASVALFNPALRQDFACVFDAQWQEFVRLYGRQPSHVDGHHHLHLCANILLGNVIPAGEKVRRGFHFWPGEKSALKRTYRRLCDALLTRRYRSTDFFFALSQCQRGDRLERVLALAQTQVVELMTHPAAPAEQAYLLGDDFGQRLARLDSGNYARL
jgi:chitin disaccharide deacetylase